MSETTRRKKDGEDKGKKNDRMLEGTKDPMQNRDAPGVDNDQKGPDDFDADLNRDNKAHPRGDSRQSDRR